MMMRMKMAIAGGCLALAGCGQAPPTSVDPTDAARAAENPPELAAVLEALEPLEGSELDAGLVLRDARADSGRLIMDLRLTSDADIDTPAKRDVFIFAFERDFAQQMCAAPALRSFIETRGGMSVNVADPDGAPVLSRSIDSC